MTRNYEEVQRMAQDMGVNFLVERLAQLETELDDLEPESPEYSRVSETIDEISSWIPEDRRDEVRSRIINQHEKE